MIEFEESITTDNMKIISFYLDNKCASIRFKSNTNLYIGDLLETVINNESLVFRVVKVCAENCGLVYEATSLDDSNVFTDKYIKSSLLSYDDFLGCILHKIKPKPECVYVIVDSYKEVDNKDIINLRREYKTKVIVVNAICILAEGLKDFVNTFVNKDNVIVALATKDKKLIDYFYTNCKKQYRDNIVIADF